MNAKPWKNEQVYRAFDDLIRLSEKSIEKKSFYLGRLPGSVLRERIIQRVVQFTFYPYCAECTKRARKGSYPFPSPDELLKLDGMIINGKTGAIRLRSKLFFRLLVDYLLEWGRIILNVIAGFVPARSKSRISASWVFGLGFADTRAGGSEMEFERFCRQGPVTALKEAEQLIIQELAPQITESDLLVYAANPVHYHIRTAKIGFVNRLILLTTCFINLFLFFATVIMRPLMAVLSKDIIQYPVVRLLDKMGLIRSVIITNSSFFQQPLWMRGPSEKKFRVHEIHYGQNAIPFLFKDDPTVTGAFPPFRHVRVDEHWIWTEGYKKNIIDTGHNGPIHVVGPIIWYLPGEKREPAGDTIRIAVFDVAPVYQSVADKMGIIHYYYTGEKMIAFLETIITVCEELSKSLNRKIKVILKSKRQFTESLHDKAYIDYISRLGNRNDVELADYRSNIFSLLGSCHFSVSIPYTTVPYVAAYLQKQAAYFDPYAELIFTNEPSLYIQTASGKEELKHIIEGIILSDTQKAS